MYSTVASLVAAAKHQLNDETNGAERFSPADLTRYAMEGQLEILKLLPHLRVSRFTITLNTGGSLNSHEQRIPDSCDFLLDVAYVSGQLGREVPVQRGDYSLFRSYVGVDAKPLSFSGQNSQFTVPRRWYYDPSNPEVFYLEPYTIQASTIVLTCTLKPSSMVAQDINPEIVSRSNTLLDYVMMRAYEVDTESATSLERQKLHRAQFYQAIQAEYDASASINSKYHLGRKGDKGGDPRR